jgi:hypothetical protein
MNLLKYDYVAMELPNVLMAYRKDLDRLPPKINSRLSELTYAVAKKHPQWTLVASKFYVNDSHYTVTAMGVYEGDEKLGVIGEDFVGRERVFQISNHRIRASKIRGSSTRTKDLNKALKIIGKMFGAKTQVEILSSLCGRVGDTVKSARDFESNNRHNLFSQVFYKLRSHMEKNWGKFEPIVLEAGEDPQVLEKLRAHLDREVLLEGVYRCVVKNHGVVVQIRGAEYVVCKRDTPAKTMRNFTSETLPLEIKAAIGMLKLVDEGSFIADKGFKYSDDEFYIMVEDELWMQ